MSVHIYKILLIEDDDSHAELIKRCFARIPLQTTIQRFPDGEQALQFLLGPDRKGREPIRDFDLIILDLRLPRINGLDILKALDGENMTREVPVVIFSTSTTESDRQLALSLGARDYISKPVGYDDFQAAIQKMTHHLTETKPQND